MEQQSNSLFNIDRINERIEEIKNLPPFEPNPHEMVYTASQLFETGQRATLWFVIRDGHQIFFKSETTTHAVK